VPPLSRCAYCCLRKARSMLREICCACSIDRIFRHCCVNSSRYVSRVTSEFALCSPSPINRYTKSDKVMILFSKNKYFIYSSTTMWSPSKYMPCACAHFSSGAVIVCNIPGPQLVGCRLRSVLRPSGCLLLIQNGVLSLPILLFEINVSRKV